MAVVGNDAVTNWLDSSLADYGLTIQAKQQLSEVLLEEDAYKRFAAAILDPPVSTENCETTLKRSWRAMTVLKDDAMTPSGNGLLLDATRAKLLTKDIFGALEKRPTDVNVFHIRTLLDALLEAHPSSVITTACAGGKDAMESHLGTLLTPALCPHTLSTLTQIVLNGCLGKPGRASAEKTVLQHQQSLNYRISISQGHRRKFLRALSDWSFLTKLIECLDQEDINPSIGEDICESLLTVVECIGYPEVSPPNLQPNAPAKEEKVESLGEEMLLAPLGKPEWWTLLISKLDGETSDSTKVAATKIMMGVFTLATGRSSRVRKANAPITDPTEIQFDANETKDIDREAKKNLPHDNKLLTWGLTTKIHQALLSFLSQLVHSLFRNVEFHAECATRYLNRGAPENDTPGVLHPGRYRVIPFTSWRLHVVTILAELLTYTGAADKGQSNSPSSAQEFAGIRKKSMDTLMNFPLIQDYDQNNFQNSSEIALNPWPMLCEWIFDYPENSLYHFHFIRLFRAICLEHHEPSLRLVMQKVKFVSNAIKRCMNGEGSPLKGTLYTCLNIMRLRSQALGPSEFLRQFLESHDLWRTFMPKLIEATLEQERLNFPIPGKESLYLKPVDINLGSRYAAQMGFENFEIFSDASHPEEVTIGKKKKKKRKKKKKFEGEDDGNESEDAD